MKTCALALILTLSSSPVAFAEGEAEVGDVAPRFKLRDLTGALVKLDELAYSGREKSWAKKRPVLVDFFRTDCSPCRLAVPELVDIHEQYAPRGLDVLLIALLEPEDGRAKLEAYLAKERLPFRVVVDDTEHFTKKYLGETVKLPATYLIDRQGRIRAVRHGGKGSMAEHFSEKIEKTLKKKKKKKKKVTP